MKSDPRSHFKDLVAKHILGPANDTFADSGENEIIGGYPLSKYFSGIIFPNFGDPTPIEPEAPQMELSFLDEEELREDPSQPGWETDTERDYHGLKRDDTGSDDFTRRELYPYSYGISFCMLDDAPKVSVNLRFGRYRQVDPVFELHPNFRISMQRNDYDLIKHFNAGNGSYLGDIIGYDQDSLSIYLKRKLVGKSVGEASGDFADLREIKRVVFERFKVSSGIERDRYKRLNTILRNLTPLYKKGWAREQHSSKFEILFDDLDRNGQISFQSEKIDDPLFEYKLHALTIDKGDGYRVVKVMLENSSKFSARKQVMLGQPILNRLCMFQSQIIVESDFFRPMPKPPLAPNATLEDKIMECQYRNADVFAQAYNCACSWPDTQENPILVQTEFLPAVIPPVTTNSRLAGLNSALNVRDNSIYGKSSDADLINRLTAFADSYGSWIETQVALSNSIESRHAEASSKIVENQKSALSRMHEGISLLKENIIRLKLFRLANAAMLVNMARTRNRDQELDYGDIEDIYYHPFQLAFLLINLGCVTNPDSDIKKNSVDLLWFPTGGGKTEAYFLLSAFSLLYRRYSCGASGHGTSVIMRYTLRLLTAQQFERASRMILSLNYVCSMFFPQLIEAGPYSIGLWIGNASSPNKLVDGEDSAAELNSRIIEATDIEAALRANKFPLSECPWCGRSLIELSRTGFNCLKNKFEIRCLNPECHFHDRLPIDLVDESLYRNPPSLLFATIDKFARLAWVDEASAFFGFEGGYQPPDLIIQDELHLISGPLGSITALFEGVVEMLCRRGGNMPRIIASTATIKNAAAQVRGLFGNRAVVTFPPPGLNYKDNFFAKEDSNNLNREYIGVYPTGKTFTMTQLKLLALLLYGRLGLRNTSDKIDNYWTVVSYYNSLRELGRMYSKARDEVQQAFSQLVLSNNPESRKTWLGRPRELTSRISGYEVKNILHSLELVNVDEDDFHGSILNAIDIVFATNMISVGLDIPRLNLLVMNGQPKSVSEYIQVTSRIARSHPGLVFTLFNPFKVRDKSHYENFASFHNHYYRFVEPISVTPYTRVAIRKLAPTLMAAYLRLVKGIRRPKDIRDEDLDEYRAFMADRMHDEDMTHFFRTKLKEHMDYLREKLKMNPDLAFKDLLHSASDAVALDFDEGDWLTMNSMREISPNTVIKLTSARTKPRSNDYE